MSTHTGFHLGPYADWEVPEGEFGGPPFDQDDPVLERQNFSGDLPTGERDGRRFDRHRYYPYATRPGQPRTWWQFGEYVRESDADLTDIDPRAEVGWFVLAFSAELAALAAYYGGPPAVRWGLVHYVW